MDISSPICPVFLSSFIVADGSKRSSWISFVKVCPSFVFMDNFNIYAAWFAYICLSTIGPHRFVEDSPFQKSHFVSAIVPLPIARDAEASRIIPIFPTVGEILSLSILLAFTPLISSMISPSFGFTEICFDIERGSTSVFPLLLRLPDITSKNTVYVHSFVNVYDILGPRLSSRRIPPFSRVHQI